MYKWNKHHSGCKWIATIIKFVALLTYLKGILWVLHSKKFSTTRPGSNVFAYSFSLPNKTAIPLNHSCPTELHKSFSKMLNLEWALSTHNSDWVWGIVHFRSS